MHSGICRDEDLSRDAEKRREEKKIIFTKILMKPIYTTLYLVITSLHMISVSKLNYLYTILVYSISTNPSLLKVYSD
jgi:hypothetical protein